MTADFEVNGMIFLNCSAVRFSACPAGLASRSRRRKQPDTLSVRDYRSGDFYNKINNLLWEVNDRGQAQLILFINVFANKPTGLIGEMISRH